MATLGTIFDRNTITASHPGKQLDFWSKSIDRILAENPSDAELHAAAAVLLEEPCIHLWSAEIAKEVAALDSSAWGFGKGVFARIKEASATYDEQASKRVCELLARSTEIEPNNTDWWRLRCILLWPRFGKIQEPRDEDWRQILEEARKHDPGNALYDLLEANQLSNDSIDFDEKGDFYVRDADCLLYTSPSPRDQRGSRMPSSA